MTAHAAAAALWARLRTPAAREQGECWEWPGKTTPKGYGHCTRNGETVAHRASWAEVNGPVPAGLWVLHHCDNRRCVRPSHLYAGTAAQNTADMVNRGRVGISLDEANGRTRYPRELIETIRQRVADGEARKAVARDLGVSASHVSRVCSGQRRRAAAS